jgi:FkbM family methyltransferase
MHQISKSCQIQNLDLIYSRYFGHPSTGTFVEVGAYDGESFSNTSCLADSGWKGIYVEPVRDYYLQCSERHRNNNVEVINCAIGSEESEVDIYIGDALSTLDIEHVKIFSEIEWSKEQKFIKDKINTIRLDTLLSKYNVKSRFEVLVVDVEGREEDVFSSFDINYWQPKMIIVELVDEHDSFQEYHNCTSSHKKLRNFIIDSGYCEIYKDEINTIFVCQNFVKRKMISMNCLGSIGKLGNQMFQYAALRSLAKKFNYEYCFPSKNFKLNDEDLDLFDCFLLDNEEKRNTDFYVIESKNPGFDDNIFDKCPNQVDLIGYFQDVRYFENNREDIKKCFTFKDNIFRASQDIFNSIPSTGDVISLHVRRGDYLNFAQHPVLPLSYYIEALNFFDENIPVLVFSDDIDWAYSQDIFQGKRFYFSRNSSNAMDLCMQTFCTYHIIANSSFSWWGAWLSNSKKVIKPRKWFDPPLPTDPTFLNVDGWTSLSVNTGSL